MKNLKNLGFGLAALVLVLGLVFTVSAFTQKQRVSHWFTFNGTSYQLVDPMNPIPPTCEATEGTELCAILVDNDKIDYTGDEPQPNAAVIANPLSQSDEVRYKDEN